MFPLLHTRRHVLRSAVGLAGMSLPSLLQLRSQAAGGHGRAKACIVVYCWGGMSHLESWDPKPEAPADLRGEFGTTSTSVPGIRFCEHLPRVAAHADKIAVVRSVHHRQGGHQGGLYVSLTGHDPAGNVKAKSRDSWPSLPAALSYFRDDESGTPRAVRLPHAMYDNGTLMAGEYGGWLGPDHDPVLIPTPAGRPFGGVSRKTGRELDLSLNVRERHLMERRRLLESLERSVGARSAYEQLDRFRKMATDMLVGSAVSEAYDLQREDPRVRAMYGNHMGGQGMLLARRLVEAGVPIVQLCAGAGDLAGGSGDNWDTHRDHFAKMKKRLLPVFDRSLAALLTDLHQRGMLDETLVVVLTDFGRTPKINGNAGRDHHPGVYSVILAGGGIRGGQVYGASDRTGTAPRTDPCTPADVHATVYRAMGIDPRTELHDPLGRPFRICDGQVLPLA